MVRVTKSQAAVMREALEFYARLKAGQIDMVLHDCYIDRFGAGDWNHDTKTEHCNALKRAIFPELNLNASYGVGSKTYPEQGIAWDIMQVLRHKLAWDRVAEEGKEKPDYPMQVQYGSPMAFSSEPLPQIESMYGPDHAAEKGR